MRTNRGPADADLQGPLFAATRKRAAREDSTFPARLTIDDLRHTAASLEDALRGPAAGIGKPEALRHVLQGARSRRITEEHRLVCLVDADDLVVLQAHYHYR